MIEVAALYIDSRGPYPKLLGPEMCWDEQRDARTYAGPWPVVAHPPCGPWGALRHLHVPNRERRDDAALGPLAVGQVRKWGGVLEQPRGSKLWDAAGLPTAHRVQPDCTVEVESVDKCDGWAIEVDQCAWGHVARKATWLYFVGVSPVLVAETVRVGGEPTHWCSGGRTKRPGMGATVPPGIKVCSAQQRRRTPVAFAEWLISLAQTVRRP